MVNTVLLYRPVGETEFHLIEQSNFEAFPPRLAEQPIFYPVTNEEYATKIARDWNARFNEEKTGYVTRFRIDKDFLNKYERHVVGSSTHEEYWIPAEDLDEFNKNIVGRIEVIAKFIDSESH